MVVNNRAQTRNFWNNQNDKLALITEKCAVEINEWVHLQTVLIKSLSGEVESGRLRTQAEQESFLARLVDHNPEIQAAYVTLDNAVNYFNTDSIQSDNDEQDFLTWYQAALDADGEIIFTEPYFDFTSMDLVISCLQAITTPDGARGIVGTDVSLKNLNAKVDALSPSPTGGTWLVSPGLKVITYRVDPTFLQSSAKAAA